METKAVLVPRLVPKVILNFVSRSLCEYSLLLLYERYPEEITSENVFTTFPSADVCDNSAFQ